MENTDDSEEDEPIPPPGPSIPSIPTPNITHTSTLSSLPPVPLQPTSTALNVNSALHRKYALQAQQMPMRVEACLRALQGLCLVCLSQGIHNKGHQTHKCKKWERYKMGAQAFEWKKDQFCSRGDKGYCYKCLLNPDHPPVHPNGSGYGQCIYDGIVFELCWIVIGNDKLLKSLATYLNEPGLSSQKEYIDWLRGKYNDDRKWRNCATLLLIWFHNTFRSPLKHV